MDPPGGVNPVTPLQYAVHASPALIVLHDQEYLRFTPQFGVSTKFPTVSLGGQSPAVVCVIGAGTTFPESLTKFPGAQVFPPPPPPGGGGMITTFELDAVHVPPETEPVSDPAQDQLQLVTAPAEAGVKSPTV